MTFAFHPARGAAALLIAAVVLVACPAVGHAQSPEAKASIARGVNYLRTQLDKENEGFPSGASVLGAYAMLKGGASKSDPVVKKVISRLQKPLLETKNRGESIYASGCQLMLLEAARVGRDDYRKEMQAIVDHIIKSQHTPGYWNYSATDEHGDTSVSQYAVLGLWAAERAEIKVPPEVFEKIVQWLVSTQSRTGGFKYRPTNKDDSEGDTLSMTIAGLSTLLVAQQYLYPDKNTALGTAAPKSISKPIGGLEDVPIEEPQPTIPGKKKPGPASKFTPSIPYARINGAARAALGWTNANFNVGGGRWALYTLYGTERMAALANVERIRNRSWYADGTAFLLRTQRANGSWNTNVGEIPATSFAILFLTRSTGKLIGRIPADFLSGGLLRGGVGLPTDLSALEEGRNGEIKKKTISGPIDELLAELQKPKNLDVAEVQKEIIKKIQIGDRKQWLQPKRRKQLLTMAQHPDPKVRQVAIWALGRTGNVDVANVLMEALENDPDLNVALDAREALCWISRKPQGFGLPAAPDSLVPEGASAEERLRIITQWRTDAVTRWKKWYLIVRPYSERDDLQEFPKQP